MNRLHGAMQKTRTPKGRVDGIVNALEHLFGRRRNSSPRTDPLDTLIATILSQNTHDQNSHRAWLNLRERFPRWEDVASASVRAVASAIEIGGLKNQKAKNIKALLHGIKETTGAYNLSFLARMSNEEILSYLLSKKGIGRKTAACVLVFSLKRDVFPVDTHIHRICNRLGLVRTSIADATFDAMQPLVPSGKAYSFHVNLIRFGREICRARNPECGHCILFEECLFKEKVSRGAQPRRSPLSSLGRDFIMTEHLTKTRKR